MNNYKYVKPPFEKVFYFKLGFSVAIPKIEAFFDCLDEVVELDGKNVNKVDVDWNDKEEVARLSLLVNPDYLYSKYGEKYYRLNVHSWNDFENAEVYYDEKLQGKVKDLEWFEISEMVEALSSHSDVVLDSFKFHIGNTENDIVATKNLDYFRFDKSLYVVNQEDNQIYNESEFREFIKEQSVDYPFVGGKYRNLTLHKMKNIGNDYKLFKMNFADSVFTEDEFFIHNTTGLVLTKDKQMIDTCVIGDKTLSQLVLDDYRTCLKSKLGSDVVQSLVDKHDCKNDSSKRNNRRNKI